MDDTTKYVLFGLLILFVIMIPGMIRFCCVENCYRNKAQSQSQAQNQDNIQQSRTQAKYVQI